MIIENRVYFFGEDGTQQDKVFDHEEVTVDGDIYYVINNQIQIDYYIIVENHVHYYGADGVRNDGEVKDGELSVGGKSYYIINNEIQVDYYIIVENHMHYYGADGVRNDDAVKDGELSVGDKTYYIVIPNSVTSIGDWAFRYCSGLTEILFKGTKEQWNAISKGDYWNYSTGSYTIRCTDGDIRQ